MTNPDNVGGLLPCPFCGGAAERIDFGPGSGDNEGGSCIACTKCQASGPVEFGYKENFVSNWNRRELCRAAPAGGDSWPLEVGDALLKWNRSHPAGPLISIGYEYGVAAKVAEIMRDSAPAGSGEALELADRLDRDWDSGRVDWDNVKDAAALLRKLQQGADENSLRAVAKRNLRSLINIGSDDKALMLKCLEELS